MRRSRDRWLRLLSLLYKFRIGCFVACIALHLRKFFAFCLSICFDFIFAGNSRWGFYSIFVFSDVGKEAACFNLILVSRMLKILDPIKALLHDIGVIFHHCDVDGCNYKAKSRNVLRSHTAHIHRIVKPDWSCFKGVLFSRMKKTNHTFINPNNKYHY